MAIEEMKQRLEELRSDKDEIVSKELNLYGGLERMPTYYLKRMAEINAETYGLQADIDAARRVAEEAEAAVKSFRLRVIDTARQLWVRSESNDIEGIFADAISFEAFADSYLETGEAGVQEEL